MLRNPVGSLQPVLPASTDVSQQKQYQSCFKAGYRGIKGDPLMYVGVVSSANDTAGIR